MQFLENYGKCEKTQILNLSQQKEEQTIQYRNHSCIVFHRSSVAYRNLKNADSQE